ncbi:C1 family peptidase [Lentilactobacillus otakiensis]|uniref:Aminopeptidase n=1 Tax=Lentilactobacillus otakiensis DSM 19908 = JCM 15040 TaxID=1423780 RepID=S4NTK3_9LACO|nr:C1 family peptidase [Lentilactobacillus otakiensis]KRL10972.1 Bleomycin hydrolase [Lentilactobacillus otakiensis DSM 19908 = JCM 15040]MBZ3777206.1 C1 family peptidase [Lentilactobacillus otakiensis]MDV3517803.1 C1 family peptidase [Lentilactobacillus otakiensis]GAD17313.1 cystein aminopeptidase [Lentilactobacillus otakiensis DSM 19908 = JCM 15040]
MTDKNSVLTDKDFSELHNDFKSAPKSDVLSRIIEQNGINQAAQDPDAQVRLNPVFSVDLQTGSVTNQKQSGRCWLFSLVNTLRHQFASKYKVKDFNLSQKYLFFWDKIERANIFYDRILATASRPADDREVENYLSFPGDDGGQWAMAAALVQKYGVVPVSDFPETANVENTGAFDIVMNRKLRIDAANLRQMVKGEKSDDEISAARKKMLSEVYRITAYSFGEPPTTVDFAYRDDDKKYHKVSGLTPKEFYAKYFDVDLDDYVVLSNSPEKDYNQLYSLPSQNNVVGGKQIQFLNLPMDVLKKATIAQLKDGETVWFGNDVLEQMDRKKGFLDSHLFRYSELFDTDLEMDKGTRLQYHQAEVSHAMTFTGVDLDGDTPTKWKVENSWGDKNGEKGYFTMNDDWMDDYVYEVVVHKKYLSDDQKTLLKQAPIELPAWDSLA